MKLPEAKNAIITEDKILYYILNKEHIYGKSKAEFFHRFGFDQNQYKVFVQNLIEHCKENEVKDIVDTFYGIKYIIDGIIKSPDGVIHI